VGGGLRGMRGTGGGGRGGKRGCWDAREVGETQKELGKRKKWGG
jgi:hypothetical protein